jgi:ATP-dependent DNA helicase RecQ
MTAPLDILKEKFGFDAFRPGQEEVIGHLLAGRSAAAVFPTGSGKSLCYQLPALALEGLTLVVSPLIALMKDQIDQLRSRGIAAERLDSTCSAEQAASVMDAVRGGRLRMLYIAPERFNNERFREAIQRVRVVLFAVDEAHCISEWGHNFRPDYLKLARAARLCRAERLLALTATATPAVQEDICRGFEIEPRCAVRTGFYRPNLTLLATPVEGAVESNVAPSISRRERLLRERLASRPRGPAIVYVTLQRTAEAVAASLAGDNFPARAYHAGMKDEDREAVQNWFSGSDQAIVVATIAFGMGIDKANIRYVYHYNLPKSLENYSQEIGRAGRDGQPAICEMFIDPADLNTLENFAYGDTPSPEAVRGLVREVFSLGPEVDLSLYDLSYQHDIRSLVTQTLLTHLELDGYLEALTPYYARYQFRPLVTSAEILAQFDGERRKFLADLFRQARPAKIWFNLDLEAAARATGATRERMVRALDYLGERQLLEVKVEGLRHRYRRLQVPGDVDQLADRLCQQMLEREARDIARVRQVLELVDPSRRHIPGAVRSKSEASKSRADGTRSVPATLACLSSRLGEHFGESPRGPCGHCSACLYAQPVAVPPRPPAAIDERVWREAVSTRAQHPDPLLNPRAMARFLCGLSSPRLVRKRLTTHKLFGALSEVAFPEVLRQASSDR